MGSVVQRGVVSLAVGGLVFLFGAGLEGGWENRIDLSQGEIDGFRALAIEVVDFSGAEPELLDPAGYEAHLVRLDDLDRELVTPCGAWSLPESGRYRVWVEGDWEITPYAGRMSFGRIPFAGQGMSGGYPVGPAGRVVLPETFTAAEHLSLRVFAGEDASESGYSRDAMARRRATTEMAGGLLFPEGRAVAMVWDERSEQVVALSRPFRVTARREVAPRFEPVPTAASHLVLRLSRLVSEEREYRDLELELRHDELPVSAELVAQSARFLVAVWYDLPPGAYELEARTPRGQLIAGPHDLAAGTIEVVRLAMDSN